MMLDGYSIRPAQPSDIPLLNAIEAAAGTIFPIGSLPEDVLAELVPHDIFMDAVNQGRLLVAVDTADEVQRPVGYAFWQDVDGSALLAQMDVHPQHGRCGLGTALVTQIVGQVAEAGFPYLYLTTFSDVPWNAPFYQKLGFVLLDAESQPDCIKESLRDEEERGMKNRVAMRYSIRRDFSKKSQETRTGIR
jgi:GNAT superfamily N-acetyltransferase